LKVEERASMMLNECNEKKYAKLDNLGAIIQQ